MTFTNKNENLSELLWVIDSMPEDHRKYYWDCDIVGYHITAVENVDNIKANGLIAHASQQKHLRPECTYMFLSNEIPEENVSILVGDVQQYAVVELRLPKSEVVKMRFDGLYNVSFDCGYSASMYFDDVSPEYITDIKIYDYKQQG